MSMDTFDKVNKNIRPDYYKFADGAMPDTEIKYSTQTSMACVLCVLQVKKARSAFYITFALFLAM